MPLAQPPADSGYVTAPPGPRQYAPARQYGAPPANPSPADVGRPCFVTQPPSPSESMWYMRPSRAKPSPSIETPSAEYSQSIRCLPASPGALTSLPLNHDSGAGQYSVIVIARSHVPCACLDGGAGTLGWVPVGAGPAVNPAPPLGPVVAAEPPAAIAADGAATATASASAMDALGENILTSSRC